MASVYGNCNVFYVPFVAGMALLLFLERRRGVISGKEQLSGTTIRELVVGVDPEREGKQSYVKNCTSFCDLKNIQCRTRTKQRFSHTHTQTHTDREIRHIHTQIHSHTHTQRIGECVRVKRRCFGPVTHLKLCSPSLKSQVRQSSSVRWAFCGEFFPSRCS